ITGELGKGGMGVVLSAHSKRRGKVALKFCSHPDDGEMADAPRTGFAEMLKERFVREIRAAQSIYDPHLVPLFGAARSKKDAEIFYYVMPHLYGSSAHDELTINGRMEA